MDRISIEQKYWDEASKDSKIIYDDWLSFRTIDYIDQFVDKFKPKNILELGSGDGRIMNELGKFHEDMTFVGIDISRPMINLAEQYKPKNCTYIQSDGRTIPINKTIDLIYCVTVFQHIPKDAVEKYISEASKHLKRGGHLLFQFIEGDEDEPFSKHHSLDYTIVPALEKNKLKIEKIEIGEVHELWTWILAQK